MALTSGEGSDDEPQDDKCRHDMHGLPPLATHAYAGIKMIQS